ncbi:MAG: hypothetical protein V1835_06160 [Candidatus Micrarchaeota archaeon]
MQRHLALIAAILILATPVCAEYAEGGTYFNSEEPQNAKVNVTDVTVAAVALYSGASTDILVSLLNYGDLAANVSANVSIRNVAGDLVEVIEYDPIIVAPQTTTIISKTWSTGSYPVGLYSANATASYDDGANQTNSFSRAFSILAVPFVQPGGSPGTGDYVLPLPFIPGNVTPVVPTAVPNLQPTIGNLRFQKTTLLKEIGQGDSVFESLTIKNVAGSERRVRFKITGAPSDWISYSPQETVLMLAEERVVNVGLTVPEDALAGDYVLKLEAIDGNSSNVDYMVLRVKSIRKNTQFPIVLKTIRLDRPRSTTNVAIDVRNPTKNPFPATLITEMLLPEFKITEDDLQFDDKPAYEILQGRPLSIRWRIQQLAPGEITRISYKINSLLMEYRPYVYWSVKQVEMVPKDFKLTDLISIKQIKIAPLQEGGTSEVTARIFYAGFDPLTFKAVLEVPSGFEITPASLDEKLKPRGETVLKFNIKAPRNSVGTHMVTMSLLLEGGYLVSQTGYAAVQQPTALGLQPTVFVVLIVVGMIMAFLHFIGRKKMEHEKRRAIELRQGYLEQLKNHIKSK